MKNHALKFKQVLLKRGDLTWVFKPSNVYICAVSTIVIFIKKIKYIFFMLRLTFSQYCHETKIIILLEHK